MEVLYWAFVIGGAVVLLTEVIICIHNVRRKFRG
jgi:hypothetical protein